MDQIKFKILKSQFEKTDLEGKIRMYIETQDLTNEQYKELLRSYPFDKLNLLEEALINA